MFSNKFDVSNKIYPLTMFLIVFLINLIKLLNEMEGPSKDPAWGPKYYMGTSLIRKCTPLGPYRRPMPRVIGGSWGVGVFAA